MMKETLFDAHPKNPYLGIFDARTSKQRTLSFSCQIGLFLKPDTVFHLLIGFDRVFVILNPRWTMLQDVLKSWQEYRDEERRLSKWLSEKESQIEDMKHIDLGDADVVKKALKLFMVSVHFFLFSLLAGSRVRVHTAAVLDFGWISNFL